MYICQWVWKTKINHQQNNHNKYWDLILSYVHFSDKVQKYQTIFKRITRRTENILTKTANQMLTNFRSFFEEEHWVGCLRRRRLVEKQILVAGNELNDARRVVRRRSDHCLPVSSFEVRLDHFVVFAVAERHATDLRTLVPGNKQSNTQILPKVLKLNDVCTTVKLCQMSKKSLGHSLDEVFLRHLCAISTTLYNRRHPYIPTDTASCTYIFVPAIKCIRYYKSSRAIFYSANTILRFPFISIINRNTFFT